MEVQNTIDKIGKDKALSIDGISDIIFKRKTWIKLAKESLYNNENEKYSKQELEFWTQNVENNLT